MSLYYLHTRRDGSLLEDPDGGDFTSVDAAREEALSAARDLWAAAMLQETDLSDRQFIIADAHGAHVLVVPFTDALPSGLRNRLCCA